MTREHDFEPVRGLPEALPAGEEILWQGAPDWRALSKSLFHVKAIAIYGGLLCIWRFAAAMHDGQGLFAASGAAVNVAVIMTLAVGLFCLLAWLIARTTVYTITNRRVVMRIGVALSITLNIPFRIVASADCRLRKDGSGDIPLSLSGNNKIAYPHLWPHARPWRFARPEPMLRGIPDAEAVAGLLATALGQAVLSQRHDAGRMEKAQLAAPSPPAIAAE